MSHSETPIAAAPTHDYPAKKARGGEIVLRARWQRILFIAGLAGCVLLALLVPLLLWGWK